MLGTRDLTLAKTFTWVTIDAPRRHKNPAAVLLRSDAAYPAIRQAVRILKARREQVVTTPRSLKRTQAVTLKRGA